MNDDIRKRLENIQAEIDAINTQKSGWQKAWEVELKNDPDFPKPEKLPRYVRKPCL